MALDLTTINRLYNWKFTQALDAAKEQSPLPTTDEILAIRALSEVFGNCGWFDSQLGRVLRVAVHDLIGDVD